MIYHYFGKDRLASILQDGFLRTNPVIVFEDLAGTLPMQLANAIWFSVNPDMENTILPAASFRGLSTRNDGDICRIGWNGEEYVRDLQQWAHKHKYPAKFFHWMMVTASLCGACWCCWRLYHRELPKICWASVEVYVGGKWERIDY